MNVGVLLPVGPLNCAIGAHPLARLGICGIRASSGRHHHFAINRITSVCGRTGRPLAGENSKYFVRQFSEMVEQTSTLNGEGTMDYQLTWWSSS